MQQQNRVFVLDKNREPLDPCHPARARKLLSKGRASVLRQYPFTIILHDRTIEESTVHPHRMKVDPGSRTTGMVVVAEHTQRVVFAAETQHRGMTVKAAMDTRRAVRSSRRSRKTRYRQARFLNRTRHEGWLPPSLESRVANVVTWVNRIQTFAPIAALSMELVRFDTQKMMDPEISGVEYQQGTLQGYEIREYLLEKWGRTCAYCNAKNTPLEIDHIHPKGLGGTDRVSNLTIACKPCNQAKGMQPVMDFVKNPAVLTKLLKKAQAPLRDAAAVNTTRWALYHRLTATGLPVEVGTGGRTRYNRYLQNLPKAHWIDAACTGLTGQHTLVHPGHQPLLIKATGHGSRQMVAVDKYGFPKGKAKILTPFVHGFQTGDIVVARVPKGKRAGTHVGRAAVRDSGYFDIRTKHGKQAGINHRHCKTIHKKDGYNYAH